MRQESGERGCSKGDRCCFDADLSNRIRKCCNLFSLSPVKTKLQVVALVRFRLSEFVVEKLGCEKVECSSVGWCKQRGIMKVQVLRKEENSMTGRSALEASTKRGPNRYRSIAIEALQEKSCIRVTD